RLEARLRGEVLHRRLGSAVHEHGDGDGLDPVRKIAAERVAAGGEDHRHGHERQGPSRHALVTMLTSRFGTTTTFSTRREATQGRTRSSPKASWRTRRSAAGTASGDMASNA